MHHPHLESTCKSLRLSGLSRTLGLRLQEAAAGRLTHAEFFELVLQDELNVRKERLLSRRTKSADFHHLRTLEDFDWSFNPSIPRKDIFELAAGHFIRQASDILFIGPPGVGKTHLAQAIGYEAIKLNFHVLYRSIFDLVRDFLRDEAFNQQDRVLRRYLKPDLLIIDDMGLKALPKHSGEYTCGEHWRFSQQDAKGGEIAILVVDRICKAIQRELQQVVAELGLDHDPSPHPKTKPRESSSCR